MWIVRNKYKLMVFIIMLYLAADLVQHKGLVRVMFPKKFPGHKIDSSLPANKNLLINKGKDWVKAVNTTTRMNELDKDCTGLECDIYFNSERNYFDVHHDVNASTGLNLDSLLLVYQHNGLKASIWLDLKNLVDSNKMPALNELVRLRNKYALANKILVETHRPDLGNIFSDSGFATSYYTPFFNPYLFKQDDAKHWVDSISAVISRANISALSGYYFQYPFLHHYFPNYPILIWAPNDRYSLVNRLYKKNIAVSKAVAIVLYP